MTIVWLKLAPALLLLFVPMGLLRGPKTRHRPVMRDWAGHWVAILTHGMHWIDLGRAVLGGWLLAEALPLPAASETLGFARHAVPLLRGVIAVAAVATQTAVCREAQCFYAPFMFVSGLLLGLYPAAAAALGVFAGLTIAAGLRAPTAYFPVLGASFFAIGYLLEGRTAAVSLALGASAAFTAWLLPVMFRRSPVLTYRAKRLTKHTHPPMPVGR